MQFPQPILRPADHAFFVEHGYVVIPEAVPPENLQAVVDLIFRFLDADPHDPETWYRPPHRPGGMVEVYQHQALWDNRQHPRVHQIFSEILGTHRLWVSTDRACLKPPRHPDHPAYDHKGFIHWDIDTSVLPLPLCVQGVLCLTDTAPDQGGFQCVPGMHRRLEEWVKTQPSDRDPRRPDLTGLDVRAIPGRAGDMIVWHRGLPHGNGHNVSASPRLAQYILMQPPPEPAHEYETQRERRVAMWRERLHPGGPSFPGDPREVERRQYQTAELTPLGRRLLGVDPWE
ncbi:MAG: phytanoyl-CoA dioxygenase family protein [Armatimonadetes bacterium]|nr:phytanoyl-CoA dioxygenase family protein [Armatimonadota bacterium]